MYRTTAQSRVLEEAFRVSDIPYRIVGGLRFYDRKEVKDVLAVFRLLYNPSSDLHLERIIDNLPVGRGIGPKALKSVQTWAQQHGLPTVEGFAVLAPSPLPPDTVPNLSGAARAAAQRLGAVYAGLREQKGQLTLASLFDAIVERTGYQASFDHESEEEMQRWANVLELRADLEKYDIVEPEEALATYLEQVALVADVDSMDDTGRVHVTLITLHSAKGLEFPVVFIAGVEEGLIPISRAVDAEFHDPLPLEEERRLFYVGITRAQRLLYLTHVGNRLSYGRYQAGVASRFLTAIPEECLQAVGRVSSNRSSVRLQDRVRVSAEPLWTAAPGRPAPAPTPLPDYQIGQRVFHAKFGEGRVIEVVAKTDDQEVAVEFARHGRKRLMASFARLDVIR